MKDGIELQPSSIAIAEAEQGDRRDPITVVIAGPPVAKARPRLTRRGIAYTPAHTRKYEAHGRLTAQLAMGDRPPIEAPRNVGLGDEPTTETQALISTIKAHISAGDKAQDKAQRHYIAAGQHLKQLKAEHDGHDGTWAEWEALLKAVGISTGRASELMQIADGRKTADGLAVANTTRSKRHRSSLRNEEARLERAIKVVITALEEAGKDERAGILDRILNPIGMTAVAAKAGNGLCRFVKDDGGRSKSGVPGADRQVGDCVARAIAIATQRPYREVHDALVVGTVHHVASDTSEQGKWARRRGGVRHFDADHGCADEVYGPYLESLGWKHTSTPSRNPGKVHLRADELPPGRLVVKISRHLVAVIDGVIHDLSDCGRSGRVHVKGYWSAPSPGCSKREEAHDNGGEPPKNGGRAATSPTQCGGSDPVQSTPAATPTIEERAAALAAKGVQEPIPDFLRRNPTEVVS
jgi:hypothetical protein